MRRRHAGPTALDRLRRETQALEDILHRRVGNRHAEKRSEAFPTKLNGNRFWFGRESVLQSGRLSSREFENQFRRALPSAFGRIGVRALLEAERAFAAQAEAPRRLTNVGAVEHGALQ